MLLPLLIVAPIITGLLVALVLMILASIFGLLGTVAMPTLAASGFISGVVASVLDTQLGLHDQVQHYINTL